MKRKNHISTVKLLKKLGNRCHYCNCKMISYQTHKMPKRTVPPANMATRDHIVAVANGGKNHRENIVMSCFFCNKQKDRMSIKEFENSLWLAKRIEFILHSENYH